MNFFEILSVANNLLAKFGSDPGIISLKEYILNLEARNSELHNENSEYIEEKAELEKRVKEYENWDAEKRKYEVTQSSLGNFLYKKKGTDGEFICPNCFESKQQAIHLQPPDDARKVRAHMLSCPNCKFESLPLSNSDRGKG